MRRGFTLVEVMVSLTITALVASVAWTSLAAGVDSSDRLRDAREAGEAEQAVRAMLVDALRHAVAGSPGGDSVFVIVRGARAGEVRLAFRSRGIEQPLGGSAAWLVQVSAGGSGLEVLATPADGNGAPVQAVLPHVRGLDVVVAARHVPDEWRADWPAGDTPGRVALTFLDSTGHAIGPVIMTRVSLEAWR